MNLKYDYWHKEIVSRFGSLLGTNMQDFYTVVSKVSSRVCVCASLFDLSLPPQSRTDLENHSVDAATTSEAVQFITLIQGLKRELKQWESQVEVFHSGQKMLERNRFQFPTSWLHVDNVEGEWSAFNEIMKRKDAIMQTQVSTIYQHTM